MQVLRCWKMTRCARLRQASPRHRRHRHRHHNTTTIPITITTNNNKPLLAFYSLPTLTLLLFYYVSDCSNVFYREFYRAL
ncbi:hypothetical protein E2C01_097466 [Portunus trituberculatus]|uniref:Uncharacterized protein n=1 Tax=Portunus trituberculatus TaxID=210409 RepID=A0A5B7K5R9_PORTR|nr:hypothetical protein [Portunus trituberculatus]